MAQKIVIVGGVGGGATVAAQIRRNDKQSEVIMFEKGEYISFANCGMPYYIGGTIEKRDNLLYPPEKFRSKYDVDVRTKSQVLSIDRQQKQIQYRTDSAVMEESYDKLILSPGATPVVPDLTGKNEACVFTLRSIKHMDQIEQFIRENQPKTAAVIGAGFIGMEMAANLHIRGLDCTIVDRSDQVMKAVDEDMATEIQEHLQNKGVKVILNDELTGYSDGGKTIHLGSGKTLHADMTIMSVGVRPNTWLAEEAELDLGSTGGIAVNEFMQTSDPDIYAIGDAAETKDFLTKEPRHIPLAWPAHRQAYFTASHLMGRDVPNPGQIGTAILKLFTLTIGSTGHNSYTLNDMGYEFKEAVLETRSHAPYYPGAEKLWLKILFDPEKGTIYGAQSVGYGGADKRLAVLATAMKGNLSVTDLPDLELAYAPPYSSSKDPVNAIGYKASEMLEG